MSLNLTMDFRRSMTGVSYVAVGRYSIDGTTVNRATGDLGSRIRSGNERSSLIDNAKPGSQMSDR